METLKTLAARYRRADNALFIPEANNATNPQGPANAFQAFGELDSFGFSPFSIESLSDAPNPLSQSYEVLRQLSPVILESRGRGRMGGFRATINEDGTVIDLPVKKTLGGIEFTVTFIEGITVTYKGAWVAGRRLNGDQTHQGRHIRLPPGKPQIQKVRFYRY